MTALTPLGAARPITAIQTAYQPYALPAASDQSAGATLSARSQTGYDPLPVTTPRTSVATPENAARSAVATQFGAQLGGDFASAAGGGAISDALQNGVAKIAAFAQNGMDKIQQAMQGDMAAAGGGQMDPAKLQQYTMQMSTYETVMRMAAKIQEKQENSMAVWLR